MERRVKQRGVSMDYLDKLKANCISCQCLNETSAIEISEECDIPWKFVEILKMDDSSWESSLEAIWQRMGASGITEDIVQKTRSIMATALPQLTLQSLKAMSKEELKEMKVPLAARHFLHTEGYCTTDQQLHNAGHSDSTQF